MLYQHFLQQQRSSSSRPKAGYGGADAFGVDKQGNIKFFRQGKIRLQFWVIGSYAYEFPGRPFPDPE